MAAKRKNSKKATRGGLKFEIAGIEIEVQSPDSSTWDRYMDKLQRGHDGPARRELLMSCAVSHSPEQVAEIVKRYPALPKRLSKSIGDLAGENIDIVTDVKECTAVAVVNDEPVTFHGPDLDDWERIQGSLEDPSPKDRVGDILRGAGEACADDKVAFAAAVAAKPGIAYPVFVALNTIAGGEVDIVVKNV